MAPKSELAGLGWLSVVGLAIVLALEAHPLDIINQWFSHDEESVITAQTDWFVGETKECYSIPLDAETAKAMHKDVGDAVYQIDCDKGPEHKVSISFYGRKAQPENAIAEWNCTRKDGSFVCKQTGALPKPNSQRNANFGFNGADWRSLCNNADHTMTLSEVKQYASQRGISPNDAGSQITLAGCGIVADPH